MTSLAPGRSWKRPSAPSRTLPWACTPATVQLTYYPGQKETQVGQDADPDHLAGQDRNPDLLPCRRNMTDGAWAARTPKNKERTLNMPKTFICLVGLCLLAHNAELPGAEQAPQTSTPLRYYYPLP